MVSQLLSARSARQTVVVDPRATFKSRSGALTQSRRWLLLLFVLIVGPNFTAAIAEELQAHSDTAEVTHDAPTQPESVKQNGEPLKKLDLRVRDLSTLVAEGYVKLEEDEETVTVTGRKEEKLPQTDSERPEPWMGIAAPVWALLNPTQAWRIFLPAPEESRDE